MLNDAARIPVRDAQRPQPRLAQIRVRRDRGQEAPHVAISDSETPGSHRAGGTAWPALAPGYGVKLDRADGPEKARRDRYKRMVARCTVVGEDINAWMVQQGSALAYSRYSLNYVDEETDARTNCGMTFHGEATMRTHATLATQLLGLVQIGRNGDLRAATSYCVPHHLSVIALVVLLINLAPLQKYANATIILSGEDLLTEPGVTFPTITPTLDGTSLVFGPGGVHDKLIAFSLFPDEDFSTSSTVTFSVTINMTHLACIAACVGSEDHDPHIMIGDGSSLVGAMAADNVNGQGFGVEMTDAGTFGKDRSVNLLFENVGYPSIGEDFDIEVLFTLTDLMTIVDISYLAGTGTFSSSMILDRSQDLTFFLIRDNDTGEQYQVNSLTIAVNVSEPSTLALFATGLAGLGFMIRRRRRST